MRPLYFFLTFCAATFCLTRHAHANEAHNIMQRLPEEKRRIALARAVQSAGEPCPAATNAFYQGSRGGTAFWNTRCTNGRAYNIGLYAAGDAKVIDCRILKTIAGVDCFTRF